MEGIKKHRANKSMYNMTGSPLKSRKSPVKGKKTSKTIHVLKDKLKATGYFISSRKNYRKRHIWSSISINRSSIIKENSDKKSIARP